ncbi:hypothetical protein AMATHDRAFT_69006 [Amanita thiersii Skay4041]|uniref:Homeobox domain-containing protein n=1 Tax=Amanita thiersii Skay4041 TaxID=703135 RepID=A0A2A9NGG9_9AGAR|nr:hypothetical protein AMATHDRAFT_69006 [Amanita thiersii Skay4041]
MFHPWSHNISQADNVCSTVTVTNAHPASGSSTTPPRNFNSGDHIRFRGTSEPLENQGFREPVSRPQRSRTAPAGCVYEASKEKRKRLRVTPCQLAQLEHYFLIDRNPTPARRKEISEGLGMQERQTQIWFQNRRAKAKIQDAKSMNGQVESFIPERPPALGTGNDFDLSYMLYEDAPATIIACTSLTIGTWHRVAAINSRFDLVAYICEPKQILVWFVWLDGCSFKMIVPFESILHTSFELGSMENGVLSFILSSPPQFYSRKVEQNNQSSSNWRACFDWTEGRQASNVLKHDLQGTSFQLAHLYHYIQAGNIWFDQVQLMSQTDECGMNSPLQTSKDTSARSVFPGQKSAVGINIFDTGIASEYAERNILSPRVFAQSQSCQFTQTSTFLPYTSIIGKSLLPGSIQDQVRLMAHNDIPTSQDFMITGSIHTGLGKGSIQP